MAEGNLLEERRDEVTLVTWNRPAKKNAFDEPLWDAFAEALNRAREDEEVSVVVVTGAGGDFSAGVDLSSLQGGVPERTDGFRSGYHKTMDALLRFDKPLVAAARGVGVGFGATFLFHCDAVYLGESARLRLPFVQLGLVPEAGSSYLLQAVVGSRRAAELFFTAAWIDAVRALEEGIATRVLPDEEVVEAAMAKAAEMARHPVSALRATKRTLKLAHADGVRRALEAEDAGMAELVGSPENVEAVTALLERRPPDFRKLRTAKPRP